MHSTDEGQEIRIGGMEFGIANFGDMDSLAAVTASLPDGRTWIVSPAQPRLDEALVLRFAYSISERARRMAAEKESGRFLGEVLAYVRSLPEGRRSHYLGSSDRYLVREAETDVLDALKVALERDDSYRAAVEFETRVPYLVADRGLIEVMDAVHGSFMAGFDRDSWLAEAAEAAEDSISDAQPFMAAQIAAWRQSSSASGTFSTR